MGTAPADSPAHGYPTAIRSGRIRRSAFPRRSESRAGQPRSAIEAASQATDAFENLIRIVAGDRSGLDAIISSWLPEARARVENEAKQSIYRGMRQVKGVAADTVLFVMILHPSEDGEHLDFVTIRGYFGVRCIRPGARLKLGIKSGASAPEAFPRTLSGQPIEDLTRGVVLERFCSGPPIEIDVQRKGEHVIYQLHWGDEVGMASARNIVVAELRRSGPRR